MPFRVIGRREPEINPVGTAGVVAAIVLSVLLPNLSTDGSRHGSAGGVVAATGHKAEPAVGDIAKCDIWPVH